MKAGFIAAICILLLLSARGQQPEQAQPSQIAAQSQQALDQRDAKEAQRLVLEGLMAFPDNEELELQLARIFIYQKHDAHAITKINAVLRHNPASRSARIELAQVYGYREEYRKSDAIYRELLSENPGDEAAALGLVHNLALEGKRDEARQQLQMALHRHPNSLLLHEYDDYLTASATSSAETPEANPGRVQSGESYFADSSGNRALYSSQAFNYQVTPNLFSRTRLDETSLWKTATPYVNVVTGWEDVRWRANRYFAIRGGAGAVRFADASSNGLYSGDLEVFPLKGLLVSGGYSRFPVIPTFDSASFNLLATGWHERIDYHTRNFSIYGAGLLSRYSDGNHGEREFGETMRWFGFGNVSVGAGYAFRHIHFQQDLNHGYFSPSQYWSHLGAGGVRLNIGKFYHGEYLGYLGGERIDAGGFTSAGEFLLRNQFFYRRWDLEANFSHFQLVQSTAAFRSDVVSGALGYRF